LYSFSTKVILIIDLSYFKRRKRGDVIDLDAEDAGSDAQQDTTAYVFHI
jgi:hypothetical protein